MLLRFSVENFLSFKDEVEFSMLPGKSRKHPEHIIPDGRRVGTRALRTAVIYGANASGKSNLIKAMSFATRVVVKGTKPRKQIPVKLYKFDVACAEKPSKFQFEFTHKSEAYIYGFSLDAQRIHNEWLYAIGSTTERPIFERTTDAAGETRVEFSYSNIRLNGSKDREFLDFTAMGTRANQLFLTESVERGVKYFEDPFNWFDKVLVFVFPDSRRTGLAIDFMTNENFQETLLSFLQLFDTGVSGIDVREFNFEEEASIPQEVRTQVMEKVLEGKNKSAQIIVQGPEGRSYLIFRKEQNQIKALKLMTVHKVRGEDRDVMLEVSEESDGTQRLLDLIPALMDLLNGERVFIIDELDRSLHPHLSYNIIELFLNNKPEQRSQLIVTTHESSLLDLDLLRRDEIWFVEKNKDGMSTVYSLEEFAPRYDKDIRKGYLLGRFGAIPFIRNVHNLGWISK